MISVFVISRFRRTWGIPAKPDISRKKAPAVRRSLITVTLDCSARYSRLPNSDSSMMNRLMKSR